MNRYQELARLVKEARDSRDAIAATLERMGELCGEVRDWYDAMPEGWQAGERGQKAESVADLDCDADTVLADLDQLLSDVEEATNGES